MFFAVNKRGDYYWVETEMQTFYMGYIVYTSCYIFV